MMSIEFLYSLGVNVKKVRMEAKIRMVGDHEAGKFIGYDTNFSEENKQSKVLNVSCNLKNAACKLKL
ncbi:hypothetical protein IFM89_004420 [Coptis chinensis]|uniref:Uncharacterized protein n=1 Tax=Coptis chinensis TaxID=261450 RepID=A0A835IM67_9MAGN|nr:hypothetical protein IFM89_004420 [Coptis chinensis]